MRLNPLTGEIASRVPAMRAVDIPRIGAAGATAQPAWTERGPHVRRAALMNAAARIGSANGSLHLVDG
jgi:acyl-CoA reductase-like NAD-dependent aldehyde dehydrogenase